MERNLINQLPSLKDRRLLRSLSNLLTTPHLNAIERAHAVLGVYLRAFEAVHSAAETAWIAKEMQELAQRLHIDIKTLAKYGQAGMVTLEDLGVHTRRKSPR